MPQERLPIWKRKPVSALFLAALIGVLVFYCLWGNLKAESNSDTEPAEGQAVMEKNGGSYEAVSLIPAQTMLFDPDNHPNTQIRLHDAFIEHPKFKGVVPEFSIITPGKSSVAVPRLDGSMLVIEWKGVGESNIIVRATNPETGNSVDELIKLNAWRPNFLNMALAVIGGLGIFLIGMKNMSEGLQIVAGSSLQKLITTLTDNRFTAILVGFVTTTLIQSSSVTSVMTVGFINSQIMTLSQGIGVIMGANIGTTFTGWILILNLTKYGLPMVGLSAFVYIFSKSERTRYIAMIVLGLGFVFFGLETMQKGMSSMKDLPQFPMLMEMFTADTYFGVLKCIAIGCLMTMVVQSSSATLGITLSLVATGAIEFNTAAALILGENIGTTITALLASIGASANARRAAYFHCCFNVIGVLWVSSLFLPVFLPFITWIIGVDPDTDAIANPQKGVALTHTLFNVANTIVFLPFTNIAANLLTKYVSPNEKTDGKKAHLTNLRAKLLESSVISIEHSRNEIIQMGKSCSQLAGWIREIMKASERDEKLIEQSFAAEEQLDMYQDEIIEFMAELLAGNVSHQVAVTARSQLRMADEIESISDYLIVILKSHLKLRTNELAIPEPEFTLFLEAYDNIEEYMDMLYKAYRTRKDVNELMAEVHSQGRYITHRVKTIRDNFLRRMSEERFDPQIIMAVNTQLNAYRRVREHAQNVAEAMANR